MLLLACLHMHARMCSLTAVHTLLLSCFIHVVFHDAHFQINTTAKCWNILLSRTSLTEAGTNTLNVKLTDTGYPSGDATD